MGITRYLTRYHLEFVVFLCGAVLMALEIIGSRLLAPYLGTSILVWTSLIGVILASLSVGYSWGGYLADRHLSAQTLRWIILCAAACLVVTVIIHAPVLELLQNCGGDLKISALLAALVLFAPASIALAMVSPFAARLRLQDLLSAGRTVGRLAAVSTIGSLVGTFGAGFFLLAAIGTMQLLIALCPVLICAAWAAAPAKFDLGQKKAVLLLAGLSVLNAAAVAQLRAAGDLDFDTQYARVLIKQGQEPSSGRPLRYFATDPFSMQSAVYLDGSPLGAYPIAHDFTLAEYFQPAVKTVLLLGGSAYVIPREILARHPAVHIDVVEIDPQMTELARKYFFFQDDARITIYHEDARTFLNHTSTHYDWVLIDAFGANFNIPFQLTTAETARRVAGLLDDDGVVIANVFSAVEGNAGRLLQALMKTYRQSFSQVEAFPMQDAQNGNCVQTVMLTAAKTDRRSFTSDDNELQNLLRHRWTKEIPRDLPILTDNFAPVEHYSALLLPDFIKQRQELLQAPKN